MRFIFNLQTTTSRVACSSALYSLSITAGLSLATVPALADTPSVVTTIKPLHSIASAVMDGVGSPHILIDGASSPHGFALKPSQAFLLQGADAVFWIGPGLAPSLEKPISSMASDAVVVELLESEGIEQLAIREGANFDAHDHDHGHGHGHGHDDHADDEHHADKEDHEAHEDHHDHDHDHDHGDDHDHDDHASKHEDHGDHEGHGHDDHAHSDHEEAHEKDEHDHAHGDAVDAHIWLNPDNGIAIANIMAETLSEIDPENAETYKQNAAEFSERIEQLEANIATELKPLEGKKFIVFHDAYHYFEHHFGLEASGAITLSPEALASADRVSDVRAQINELDVTCVFQEPQFDAKLVDVVLEGSDARKGTLDPLGTELANGPDLYPELLGGLSKSLADCLSGNS